MEKSAERRIWSSRWVAVAVAVVGTSCGGSDGPTYVDIGGRTIPHPPGAEPDADAGSGSGADAGAGAGSGSGSGAGADAGAGSGSGAGADAGAGAGADAGAGAGAVAGAGAGADAGAGAGGNGSCPAGMALTANGGFCIDRYEAALETRSDAGAWVASSPYNRPVAGRTYRAVPALGLTPQGYISGAEAAAACTAAGKRLCSSTEWLAACRGPQQFTWPYGNAYVAGACNDRYDAGHPVVNFFGTSQGIWDGVHMNDPGINQQPNTVATGGAFAACVTPTGVYDLHGNLHEWVSDHDGTFRGGFYADARLNGAGCLYRTTAHTFTYHDYSTGFRCCATP